tara:strand:- start:73 stop:618 length:546 start_codon:yes stop_codon:yes gene_type:complete
MSVTIELDFTGKTPAGGSGLGYLQSGLHKASIVEFKHYEDSNRLYVYMATDGVRHRESFSLQERAIPFVMAFLVSAGVPETKLQGKVKFPFNKLEGKTVYFNYTAPTMGSNGQPVEGSYPEYRFIKEAHYTQMEKVAAAQVAASQPVASDESPVANGKTHKAVPTNNSTAAEDDLGFLLDD